LSKYVDEQSSYSSWVKEAKSFKLFIYFNFLGLLLQGGNTRPKTVRILGVLQRLALCYFFTAVLVLIFDDFEDESSSSQWPIGKYSMILFRIFI
jgi:predicted acyltransferase